MSLELKNPEDFYSVSSATINCDEASHLIVTNKGGVTNDWWINSELGGKQIFSRIYGKGAKWINW